MKSIFNLPWEIKRSTVGIKYRAVAIYDCKGNYVLTVGDNVASLPLARFIVDSVNKRIE